MKKSYYNIYKKFKDFFFSKLSFGIILSIAQFVHTYYITEQKDICLKQNAILTKDSKYCQANQFDFNKIVLTKKQLKNKLKPFNEKFKNKYWFLYGRLTALYTSNILSIMINDEVIFIIDNNVCILNIMTPVRIFENNIKNNFSSSGEVFYIDMIKNNFNCMILEDLMDSVQKHNNHNNKKYQNIKIMLKKTSDYFLKRYVYNLIIIYYDDKIDDDIIIKMHRLMDNYDISDATNEDNHLLYNMIDSDIAKNQKY